MPNASTCTEWSITSSAGASGLIFAGSPPISRDRVAHRRQVDDRGHAGEVLHQHARGREGDLLARLRLRVPARERLDVGGADRAVALGAQQVLQQHLQRERQPRHVKALLQRVQPEDLVLPPAYLKRALRAKAVVRHTPPRAVYQGWTQSVESTQSLKASRPRLQAPSSAGTPAGRLFLDQRLDGGEHLRFASGACRMPPFGVGVLLISRLIAAA